MIDQQSDWFAIQRISEGTYLVAEPMHVNSYLIVGSKRAVLFDTGLGVGDIRAEVTALTDRPVLVVNSHHHLDHVGGNASFEGIAIHREGAELLARGPSPQLVRNYWAGFAEFYAEYQIFRSMDAASFQVLAPEMQMRPLPSRFDVAKLEFSPSIASHLLQDGDTIDLGDRELQVLHMPGHSRDSICLLDPATRTIFTGDTINSGPLYAHLAGASVTEFARSAQRLAELDGIDSVLMAHGGRYRAYPELITRIAKALESVEHGAASLVETVDAFNSPVQEALFNDFSIVVPRDYRPSARPRPGPDTGTSIADRRPAAQ